MTDHFKPLWARNVPKFGIAHAMALGVCYQKDYVCVLVVVWWGVGGAMCNVNVFSLKLGPWLAVEVPDLIEKGLIRHEEKDSTEKK